MPVKTKKLAMKPNGKISNVAVKGKTIKASKKDQVELTTDPKDPIDARLATLATNSETTFPLTGLGVRRGFREPRQARIILPAR